MQELACRGSGCRAMPSSRLARSGSVHSVIRGLPGSDVLGKLPARVGNMDILPPHCRQISLRVLCECVSQTSWSESASRLPEDADTPDPPRRMSIANTDPRGTAHAARPSCFPEVVVGLRSPAKLLSPMPSCYAMPSLCCLFRKAESHRVRNAAIEFTLASACNYIFRMSTA